MHKRERERERELQNRETGEKGEKRRITKE